MKSLQRFAENSELRQSVSTAKHPEDLKTVFNYKINGNAHDQVSQSFQGGTENSGRFQRLPTGWALPGVAANFFFTSGTIDQERRGIGWGRHFRNFAQTILAPSFAGREHQVRRVAMWAFHEKLGVFLTQLVGLPSNFTEGTKLKSWVANELCVTKIRNGDVYKTQTAS